MKKSFTLLEILVVIGIIAILVTLGFASYSTIQKKARDAKRQSDLKSAQQVMEQCYSVNSFIYPLISGDGTNTITATCDAPNNNITFTITDPLGVDTYLYTVSSTTSDYTITVDLETSTTFTVSNQQ